MNSPDFTTSIVVNNTPSEVFNAAIDVRNWWSQNIKGSTDMLNGIFNYHSGDSHRCQIKIIEFTRDSKVVWEVLDNYFDFTENEHEWKGDKIIFDIKEIDNKTTLQFTQQGLNPTYECYERCAHEWTNYMHKSLYNLITVGKGSPEPHE